MLRSQDLRNSVNKLVALQDLTGHTAGFSNSMAFFQLTITTGFTRVLKEEKNPGERRTRVNGRHTGSNIINPKALQGTLILDLIIKLHFFVF